MLECGVIGIPDPRSGDAVKLFAVKKDQTSAKWTYYKVPRLVDFRRELPKTNVGRILRRQLRGESQEGLREVSAASVSWRIPIVRQNLDLG